MGVVGLGGGWSGWWLGVDGGEGVVGVGGPGLGVGDFEVLVSVAGCDALGGVE